MNARAQALISSEALAHNFNVLSNKVPHLKLIPMIKANAYGHGMVWAASVLDNEKKVHAFGVATLSEAIELRQYTEREIIVFSDAAPWTEERHQACKEFSLSPVFSNLESFKTFLNFSALDEHAPSIPYHLEFNTGMNRLGIELDAIPFLSTLTNNKPQSIFTHLAEAEVPKSKLTLNQMKKFEMVSEWAIETFPTALLHFGNSAAIWNAKQFPLMKVMQLARPGLSLYGVRPFEEARGDTLKRVLNLSGPVLNEIALKKGDKVGYGGTYTCKNARGEKIAVIGAGYADGIFRALSNEGFAVFQRKKLQLLGRVSMDLSAVQAPKGLNVGDRVEFWGENVDPYDQANAAGTNPYEIMTRIGERVERVYT